MPCYSRVTRTKMEKGERIAAAMRGLGYAVEHDGATVTGKRGDEFLQFTRAKLGTAWETTARSTDVVNAVQRKYSEIGVREWAKSNGFTIARVESKGKMKITMERVG